MARVLNTSPLESLRSAPLDTTRTAPTMPAQTTPSQTSTPPTPVSPNTAPAIPARPVFANTYILRSRPYLTPAQLTSLSPPASATTPILTATIPLLHSLSASLQFPVRTTNTSLLLLHRLLLHHPTPHLLAPPDTAAALLLTAAKIEDTLKKSREILTAVWSLKNPGSDPDAAALDDAQRRVLGVERQILEAVGFDFRVRHAQPFVVKFCRVLRVSRELARTAWDVAAECYKTRACLTAPPHVLGLASVLLAARMEGVSVELGDWARWECAEAEVLAVVDEVLELWTVMPGVGMGGRWGEGRVLEERIWLRGEMARVKGEGEGVGGKGEAELERGVGRREGCTVRFMIDPERERGEWELLEVGMVEGRRRGGEMGAMKMEGA